MKPCCLTVHPNKSQDECGSMDPTQTGGGKGWSNECPKTADEAATTIQAQQSQDTSDAG